MHFRKKPCSDSIIIVGEGFQIVVKTEMVDRRVNCTMCSAHACRPPRLTTSDIRRFQTQFCVRSIDMKKERCRRERNRERDRY